MCNIIVSATSTTVPSANANNDELDNLQEELIDRFGLLPEQGEALVACHRLRIAAKPLGNIKIDASDTVAIQYQCGHRPNGIGQPTTTR